MYKNRYYLGFLKISCHYSMKPQNKPDISTSNDDLEYANAAGFCFSILQPYVQGLLHCLIIFTPLVSHENF